MFDRQAVLPQCAQWIVLPVTLNHPDPYVKVPSRRPYTLNAPSTKGKSVITPTDSSASPNLRSRTRTCSAD